MHGWAPFIQIGGGACRGLGLSTPSIRYGNNDPDPPYPGARGQPWKRLSLDTWKKCLAFTLQPGLALARSARFSSLTASASRSGTQLLWLGTVSGWREGGENGLHVQPPTVPSPLCWHVHARHQRAAARGGHQ
jgi:hypothetical protein